MNTHKAEAPGSCDRMGDLLSLPGMDMARVRTLMARVNVRNRADLKRALATGKLAGLDGFSRQLKSRLQAALETGIPRDIRGSAHQ
jgi:DNA polymerase/3'-5' exonuclease PolX